jgi:hypothetical protein
MDLFMEKPVNRDKLRRMLDLLEQNRWRGSAAAVSSKLEGAEQAAPKAPPVGVLDSERCESMGSFSSGVDIQVVLARFSSPLSATNLLVGVA